jgi:hypothetical protein
MALLCTFAWSVLAVIFLPYLLHHVLLGFFKGRDLKKRYNAEWALVTGASSGAPQCSIGHRGLRVQPGHITSEDEQYDAGT